MTETNQSLVCARCLIHIADNAVRVLIGRFIYCLVCGDEKMMEILKAKKEGRSDELPNI